MKKITLLLMLLTVSFGFSQVVLQDFESGGLGAPFGNLGSATIVADPEPMGTRGMVAELIASTAGEVWQGTNIDIDQDVDLTTDKTMSIDVYSTTAISILVKVTGSGDGGPDSSVEANHTGAGWETLTVTFNTGQDGTATANGTYTNFVVYPNWDSMANGYINPAIARTVYVDNISGNAATADPCSNGMMDPGEEGVDCGGTCPNACPGAAVVLQDFESGGLGAPFGNLGSATIVADPEVMGTRGMVAELIASTAGEVWQGTNIDIDQDVDLTTDKTMSIDVYSTTAISILVKVTGSGDGGPDSSVEANHTGAGWETLTVTFNTGQDGTATANGTYTNFVVYPNWDSMANGYINPAIARTVYVDNISGIPAAVDLCSNGMMDPGEEGVDCGGTCPNACPAPPMVAAPTPPARNPQDVVSIYSDAYAAIPGINLDAPFCGAGAVTETTAGGDSVLAYNGQACQGIDFDSERQDITGLTNLHVDLFIEVGTDLVGKVFNILVVNPTGDTPINIDINALMPAPVPGTWYSYDMPVSISDPIARQITVVSNLNDAVWYDNLYLYSNTVVNQDCTGAIPLDLDGSTVDFGNVGATDSGVDASCDSGIISDVWYSFVGTITEEAYFQTNAPNLSVWSGACGSLTEIACNPGTSAVPVMDGVTYYVRVNDDGTARAPGNFTLAANESTFSNNDFNLSSIRVYPNPTNDSWNIEGANVTIDTIEVYDILGKRVQTLSPNSQQTAIDASGLKTGLYLAKLYSGNAVRTIKLVKN